MRSFASKTLKMEATMKLSNYEIYIPFPFLQEKKKK